ncbi:hypothetical protein [Polaribacter septentrionalilitoris]|uniref:hypothetical protein n=1 Tax=Polaribacter septentrionalilitoris TaxID=2494657 RepID=UPI001357B596|nr:hypothetical protein [Polaribacter septentrionalilitoris]
MNNKVAYCFSANRICHHDDYFLLLSKYISIKNIKSKKKKIAILLSKKKVVFLDIDSLDLIFFPIIMLRSLWGGKGLAISVRTEYLLEERTFKEFIFHRRRLIYIKSMVKRILFYLIRKKSSTNIVSIHKGHKQSKKLKKYVNSFIYDPQLWDLAILNLAKVKPIELRKTTFQINEKTILVAGRFDKQRSKFELLEYLSSKPRENFIIAGKIDDSDMDILREYANCLLINRYVSNEELMYLYDVVGNVYCFYSNDRPSGFFGRALQFNKNVIVRKNRFLHKMFNNYKNLIPIVNLSELNSVEFNSIENNSGNSLFDDSEEFKNMLEQL